MSTLRKWVAAHAAEPSKRTGVPLPFFFFFPPPLLEVLALNF